MPAIMFNFDTNKMESIDLNITDDNDIISFLPIFPEIGGGPARNLFRCLRLQGKEKLEALEEVLRASITESAE